MTLANPRHEQFAHLVAGGQSPTRSYASVYGSEKGAPQSANRLRKDAKVAARIEELRKAVELRTIEQAAVSRASVLQRLDDLSKAATSDKEYAAAIRALELIGKEFGMFKGDEAPDAGPKTISYKWLPRQNESSATAHGQASSDSTTVGDGSRATVVQ